MPTFTLTPDQDAENPRTFESNCTHMVCGHRKYILGDDKALDTLREQIRGHKNYTEALEDDFDFSDGPSLEQVGIKIGLFAVHLPLYLYDHSGITMSTKPFSCRFDSGRVGFIYMTDEQVETHVGASTPDNLEKSQELMVSEVEIYDTYIRGDVYAFSLEDDDGDIISACSGFYGSDIETNGILERLDKEYHALARASV